MDEIDEMLARIERGECIASEALRELCRRKAEELKGRSPVPDEVWARNLAVDLTEFL